MQKRVLSSAIALALTALASGSALAQSSVTIYGNVDVGFDHINRKAGTRLLPENTASAAINTANNAVNNALSNKLSTNRVTPDLSSQSALGFKGTEDLGGGMKANFVLEGQMSVDAGNLARDGRLFGRQAFAGITTPYGEIRLGRQYAPIFFSSAVITTERFGGTDQFIEGGLSNSLNIRWDNALTYSAQVGDFRGQLGYSPNSGVPDRINFQRGGTASATAGSILGGNNSSAGGENKDGRGRSYGLFGAYVTNELTLSAGYGRTNFDNTPVYLLTDNTSALFKIDDYSVWNLGAKYKLVDLGLTFSGAFGHATYAINSTTDSTNTYLGLTDGDLRVSSLVLGTRYDIGAVGLLAQWSETKFRNEGRGKNTGYTLGAEYSLSKRTTVYTRYEQLKDKGVGPAVVLTATGIRETPTMVGANITPEGKTTLLAVGVRHSF